ncbi:translation initiation factor IF-3 [Bacteroidetes/Chlorobi group bacterium Naka2016]|nr:MAG: translation initiation factor IF-3 [Bacteroidetes/Chlorobi group bacterium Naka2016]
MRGKQSESKYKVNNEIRVEQVRLIDEQGKMIGIYPTREALKIASERDLDLVLIAPQADPPVARIIDYGKFIFEQQKKEKAERKKQAQQQLKEIRFKWRTDTHDFNFKVRHAREFLLEGNKVKASVFFRGREIMHQEVGEELLNRFIQELSDISKIDQSLKSEGKRISVILAPDKAKIQQYEKQKKQENQS